MKERGEKGREMGGNGKGEKGSGIKRAQKGEDRKG